MEGTRRLPMNNCIVEHPPPGQDPGAGSPLPWILAGSFLLLILLAIFAPRKNSSADSASSANASNTPGAGAEFDGGDRRRARVLKPGSVEPAQTAEEIVTQKVVQFGRNRRELAQRLAKRFKVPVSPDVERFFAALESGRWEEIDAAHKALLEPGQGLNQPRSDELHHIWRPIQEAWGAAREAHDWPAQTLFNYGNSVLTSLRPGMVYAAGTDPGCFIPTMLNETTDGDRHIVLTQNALADGTYLDYLNTLYGDQMTTLTKDDSERAFKEYTDDAQKRLEHDQQFPNEPKQIRPGENVRMVDGKLEVSGQVSVMAINEKLFQTLMQNNPGLSFAMEQSFPFKSMYANTSPLGPVMELGVQDPQNALTAERAAQSVDYWRATAEQLLSDPAIADGSDPRKAYSKLIAEQAELFLARNYAAEAEQAFRIANEICPSSPEAVCRYVNLLVGQNRIQEAIPVVENAMRSDPANRQFQNLMNELQRQAKR